MFPEVMARKQAELDVVAQDHAKRIAKLAGLSNAEEKVELEVPATIRYGDAALYALLLNEACAAVIEESLQKLEGGANEPVAELEYPDVPPEGPPEGEPEPDSASAESSTLEDIDGIGPDLAQKLWEAGYDSPDDLRSASDEELLAIDGLGNAKLKQIREDLA